MTMNGSDIRDIARVLRVSPTTVLKVIRERVDGEREARSLMRIKDLEVDEFWSLV
ncbi:MAG: hypothetical protein M3430_10210 [Acidobacteriota bacterium]|nr:hypothetical protein [Acidobacteriota bacterium]